jgi:hypothetical protein
MKFHPPVSQTSNCCCEPCCVFLGVGLHLCCPILDPRVSDDENCVISFNVDHDDGGIASPPNGRTPTRDRRICRWGLNVEWICQVFFLGHFDTRSRQICE